MDVFSPILVALSVELCLQTVNKVTSTTRARYFCQKEHLNDQHVRHARRIIMKIRNLAIANRSRSSAHLFYCCT